ncbi:MAG: nucleoside-triphosphatase [Oscillospiraceae bacterium]
MAVFLTGDIQVGKSTMIRKVYRRLPGVSLGGFLTQKHQTVDTEPPSVYLLPVTGEPSFSPENRVGICRTAGGGPRAFPEVFDRLGAALLDGSADAQLLLMDEIGRMERDAAVFSQKVLTLLDSGRPILGVVRKEGDTPLLRAVRAHPKVRLLEVTRENRDTLAEEVLRLVRRELNRFVDSAGALVFRGDTVLMIAARDGGWSFPKGHIEGGETPQQAAVREVREETGIRIGLDPVFRAETRSALAGERRKITYFLGWPTGGRLAPQEDETAEAAWQSIADVPRLLRFQEDAGPFQSALLYREGKTPPGEPES